MQLRNKLHTQRGFTLIEIAIVLTIVGLIIGGIWLAASTVFSNQKRQNLSSEIVQVIQNAKTLFSNQGSSASTAGFTTANAISSGIFPAAMINTAGKVVTPYDSTGNANSVTLVAGATTNALILTVGVTPGMISQDACTNLLATLGSLNNLQKLGVTSLAGTTGADLTTGGTVAVTPAAAAGACTSPSSGTVGNTVTVNFNAAG